MSTPSDIASAADAYARRGFRVVIIHGITDYLDCTCPDPQHNGKPGGARCDSAGKHPRFGNWQRDPSDTNPQAVARWFRRYPESNVGLAMGGPRRLVALDVDGPRGAASLVRLERELGALPATLTSRSGRAEGGRHLVFALPPDADLSAVRNRAGGLAEGLDVRAEGGQIVAPPSLHASGGRYAWLDWREPAQLPAAWCAALTAERTRGAAIIATPPTQRGRLPNADPRNARPMAYARAVLNRACLALLAAPCGTRNSTAARLAFSVGGYVWTGAYSAEDAARAMLDATRAGDWHRDVEATTATTLRRQVAAGAERPRGLPLAALGRGESGR